MTREEKLKKIQELSVMASELKRKAEYNNACQLAMKLVY